MSSFDFKTSTGEISIQKGFAGIIKFRFSKPIQRLASGYHVSGIDYEYPNLEIDASTLLRRIINGNENQYYFHDGIILVLTGDGYYVYDIALYKNKTDYNNMYFRDRITKNQFNALIGLLDRYIPVEDPVSEYPNVSMASSTNNSQEPSAVSYAVTGSYGQSYNPTNPNTMQNNNHPMGGRRRRSKRKTMKRRRIHKKKHTHRRR